MAKHRKVVTVNEEPRGVVEFEGVEYEVKSVIDLTYGEMLDIFALAASAEKEDPQTVADLVPRIRKQLQSICPSLPDSVLENMSYRTLTAFAVAAGNVDVEEEEKEVTDPLVVLKTEESESLTVSTTNLPLQQEDLAGV